MGAVLDGGSLVLTPDEGPDPVLAGALRVAEALEGGASSLIGVWQRAPLQAIAKLHALAAADLTDALCTDPPPAFRDADRWRVHFHVPIDADRLGPLGTTKAAVRDCLAAVMRLPEAPHVEVETYTWEVLPGGAVDLVAGLTRELEAVAQWRG